MPHKLCMIPGPVEFDQHVLDAMATPATSHVSPDFIEKFGSALQLLRKVFHAPHAQPFVVAGSGTLTWDMTASNLLAPGDKVLVINTGVFGDWFGECLEVYGATVTHLRALFGDRPSLDEIRTALSKQSYKLVTITHVDTSSSVLSDAKSIAALVKEVSPNTLIALDGVCSVGAEEIRQEEWGIDVVTTASQKALGTPPGLAILLLSPRALQTALSRTSPPTSYYASFKKWHPIMQNYEARKPSYFATPPVQLVMALEVSLRGLVEQGMEERWRAHREVAGRVKERLERLGLKLVAVNRTVAANTLTAAYYPEGVDGPAFLKTVSEAGIVIAGGLHPVHGSKYFRVGHMNISATDPANGHVDRTLEAIEKALQFTGDMSVHEVCRELRDKFGDGSQSAGDHGLLWPEQGKWLLPAKVLDYYDLKSGDALEYRKKHRMLRVKLMDGSTKMVLVDDSSPTSQIVEIICEKIGISNPEEYSVMPENPALQVQGAAKTKGGKDLAAGDESRWLNPERTLREQGLTEADAIILKKKFFFTDQNIDRNDPVQLNLMYNQAKEMIVSGKHPCTAEEGSQFAAIQMQIQYGNHEPDKHKMGFLSLQNFLPPEYRKTRDVEKRIYMEHSKLQGLTELNGKFRYVQLSRSLKTYGITFFLVHEPHPKRKNKTVPVLLGVTKQSVVRMDVETKEMKEEWRLTKLRRWAASKGSFTLDLGDYANDYYTVETGEGEQISALIAGYIDIILKKRKEAEKVVEVEEEEQATVEEYVAPSRATNVGIVSGGHRTATEGRVAIPGMVDGGGARGGWGQRGQMGQGYAQFGQATPAFGTMGMGNAEISGAQQSLLQRIGNGYAMVNNAAGDMAVAANLPPLGNDAAAVQWKQHTVDVNAEAVSAQIASNLAATASLINQATGYVEEMDYESIGTSIGTITSNLSQLAQGIKLLAGLQENGDDQQRLLEAGRAVAKAIADALDAVQPICVGQIQGMDNFYAAGKHLAEVSSELLSLMGRLEVNEDSQNELTDATKGVTKAMAEFVNSARNVASTIKDPVAQQTVVADTKAASDTAPSLVACVNVISPTVTNALCFDRLTEAAMYMREAMGDVIESGGVSPNARLVQALKDAAGRVEECIAKLLDKAKRAGNEGEETALDRQYDALISSLDAMLENMGTAEGIATSAKDLTVMSTQFVSMLRAVGSDTRDEEERDRLLTAATLLADATTKMVASAKDAAKNLADPNAQGRLKNSLRALHEAANIAAGPQLAGRAFQKLNKSIKDAVASSNQLISASRTVGQSNRNQTSQLQLNAAAKRVAETTPAVVGALKNSSSAPEDQVAQMKLIQAAKQLVGPGNALVAAAKVAGPTTADSIAQNALLTAAKQNADDLRNLEKAIYLTEEATAGLELRNALEALKLLQTDIQDSLSNVEVLEEMEGFSAEQAQLELSGAIKGLTGTIAQLQTGVAQRSEKVTGTAATDAVASMQTITFASIALAALEDDMDVRRGLLDAARDIADVLGYLIQTAEGALEDPNMDRELQDAVKALGDATAGMNGRLPGQRDLDAAFDVVQGFMTSAKSGQRVEQGMERTNSFEGVTYQGAQGKLQVAASSLTVAVNALVRGVKGTPAELQEGVQVFQNAMAKMCDGIGAFSSVSTDENVKGQLEGFLDQFGMDVEKLLNATRNASLDSNNPAFKLQLANAVKAIGDEVNKILDVCSASAPGHTECNAAFHTLAVASGKLDNVNEPSVNQEGYAENLTRAVAGGKSVTGTVNGMTADARSGNTMKMAQGAVELANAVLTIVEANVRAAHLIGVADASTVASTAPVIDQGAFTQASVDIKDACKRLVDPANSQQQILAEAGLIAKHTSNLCTSCKNAGNSPDVAPVAKQTFVSAAKDIATKTSNLVNSIKQLAVAPGEGTRGKCEGASVPLVEAVDRLVAFAMSPEFGGSAAKVGTEGLTSQRPIIDGTRGVISEAQSLVNTAKTVCSNPKDEPALQLLQVESRALTDSVQALLGLVSSSAPGQKECDGALVTLSDSVATLDAAIVEATANNLEPQQGGMKSQLVDSIRALTSLCEVIAKAARTDAAQLGASVGELPVALQRTATASVGIASNLTDMQAQMNILEHAKELGDGLVSFVLAAKTNGGNPKNTTATQKVDDQKKRVRDAASKLIATLEGSGDQSGEFTKATEKIEGTVSSLDTKIPDRVTDTYQVYGAEVESQGKLFVELVGEIVGKAKTPAQFRTMAAQIGDSYVKISDAGCLAVRAAESENVKTGLQDGLREMGGSCIKLIEAMRAASGKSAADSASRVKLSQAAREVSNTIVGLVNVAKEGSRGLQRCQEATGLMDSTIVDLEGLLIFAGAGQLDPMDSKDNFARHKDALLQSAKGLLEVVKGFIVAVQGTQDELGNVALNSVTALEALRDEVRKGATSITSSDKHMQQQLLSAAKSVSEALQGLVGATANACGRPDGDPSMDQLSEAVKAQYQALADLVRVTRLLGDEASRGTRALDGAVSDVDDAVRVLHSAEPAQGTALPDEVAGLAKQLASAAAALVASSTGKQDDIVAASNAMRKQVADLVRAAKAATDKAPEEQQAQMKGAVQKAAEAVKFLLSKIKILQESNTPQNKASVQMGAKDVAQSVNAIVAAAGMLVPGGYVDPNDPNVIAERELLAAASAIEAAARKLAAMAPPERREANEDLSFEGQIFEAAKAIAAATAALVRSATGAQREIVAKGRVGTGETNMYFNDGTWSDGLVSAAKMVAAATGDLCEAANMAVKGKVQRERVIVAARAVNAATVQLLAAASVRADPNSQAQIRLRAAGKAVTNATDNLVRAAEENMAFDDTDQISNLMKVAGTGTSGRVAEMEAQMNILKMEKELERARHKLGAIRKGKYDAAKQDPAGSLRRSPSRTLDGKVAGQ
ncbi:Talin-1 [Rhizophlyctis rosea]|uniref:alanine--glyoxylate transaminase n=1 Tax=Rhizophlyctis rosea TaxID=64517 RepID=A0AAD5SA24_9FUNG|nr:Talin-1 [Rhizophlyctis rosea]